MRPSTVEKMVCNGSFALPTSLSRNVDSPTQQGCFVSNGHPPTIEKVWGIKCNVIGLILFNVLSSQQVESTTLSSHSTAGVETQIP